MYLAERGVFLGGVIWVREFRRLKASGHQTAIVTTDYQGDMPRLSAAMFARWSQENFFAYMKKHYGLDKLITYETEAVADTKKLINPEYRRLDGEVRKNVSLLNRLEARFGSMSLECDIAPGKVEAFEQKKAEIQEELGLLKEKILDLKDRRKKVQRHITYGELPEEGKFERLAVNSKHMIDTVKMVVYRAETAMANILREKLSREDDARTLLRAIYATEADIIPDEKNGMLTIRLHNLASRMQNEALKYLCDELNATETTFPGTKFRFIRLKRTLSDGGP
jgi:chromosome segregation ATPase